MFVSGFPAGPDLSGALANEQGAGRRKSSGCEDLRLTRRVAPCSATSSVEKLAEGAGAIAHGDPRGDGQRGDVDLLQRVGVPAGDPDGSSRAICFDPLGKAADTQRLYGCSVTASITDTDSACWLVTKSRFPARATA